MGCGRKKNLVTWDAGPAWRVTRARLPLAEAANVGNELVCDGLGRRGCRGCHGDHEGGKETRIGAQRLVERGPPGAPAFSEVAPEQVVALECDPQPAHPLTAL